MRNIIVIIILNLLSNYCSSKNLSSSDSILESKLLNLTLKHIDEYSSYEDSDYQVFVVYLSNFDYDLEKFEFTIGQIWYYTSFEDCNVSDYYIYNNHHVLFSYSKNVKKHLFNKIGEGQKEYLKAKLFGGYNTKDYTVTGTSITEIISYDKGITTIINYPAENENEVPIEKRLYDVTGKRW